MPARPTTCYGLGRRLGCYGAATVTTRCLDALAVGASRFEHAFATSSGRGPSRSAIATGRYPHGNGVLGLTHHSFGWGLRDGERHIAALPHEAGHSTHLFSLRHVTVAPTAAPRRGKASGKGHGRASLWFGSASECSRGRGRLVARNPTARQARAVAVMAGESGKVAPITTE